MSEHAIREYLKTFGQSSTEQLLDFFRPVGSYYETSNNSFDPNTTWGGTWELLDEGYVLLSGSRSGTYRVGREYGENTHTLTEKEMPSHSHRTLINQDATPLGYVAGNYSYAVQNIALSSGASTSSEGGGQPHNIMQKSKAVYIWHRTA